MADEVEQLKKDIERVNTANHKLKKRLYHEVERFSVVEKERNELSKELAEARRQLDAKAKEQET